MNETFAIKENTQLTFEDLRIGVANIADRSYLDSVGNQRSGLITGLWLFHRTQPDVDRQEWAWAGKLVIVGNYKVTVITVQADSVKLSISN